MLSIGVLLAALVGSGCSQSGDFGAFLVAEAAQYGGHAITNTNLPTVKGRWKIRRDKEGFTANASGASFEAVDKFMLQAFGPPHMPTITNLDNQPHTIWAAKDIGVAIQCIGRSNGVEIICLRGSGGQEGE